MSATYFGRTINEIHCTHCSCPKEIWKPLDGYQSDRSCEFYCDVDGIAYDIDEKYGYVDFQKLRKACEHLKEKFSDIPDFKAAIKEIVDSYEEIGIYNVRWLSTVK